MMDVPIAHEDMIYAMQVMKMGNQISIRSLFVDAKGSHCRYMLPCS